MSYEPNSSTDRNDALLFEEQLVAYLDGELDQQAAREIEARLATDPDAQQTLRRLERTWEMLDTLGRAETGDAFTRSTMEAVAVAAEQEVQQQREELPLKQRRQWLLGVCAMLGAAMLGYLATALLWPNPNSALLRDLPVLERVDQYQEVGPFQFLDSLYQEGLFPNDDAQTGNAP